ncbi:hypothetical protein LINPERPRIM_LOCUS21908, partial [Linum perenne]
RLVLPLLGQATRLEHNHFRSKKYSSVLQEFPGQATGHWSFLRHAGAVDHETV